MKTIQMVSPTSTLSNALLAYQKMVVSIPTDNELIAFQKYAAFNCRIGNYYDIIVLVKAISRSLSITHDSAEYRNLRADFATFYDTCQSTISYGCFLYHCIDTVRSGSSA